MKRVIIEIEHIAEGATEQEELDALYGSVAAHQGISLSEAQTLVDDYLEAKQWFKDYIDAADTELAWIETNLPLIDTMTNTELRTVIKRIMKQNRGDIRSWLMIVKVLKH